MAAMCVMVGEEREREGGQVRPAVSEHVYHWVRERESERQTDSEWERGRDRLRFKAVQCGGLVSLDFFLSDS